MCVCACFTHSLFMSLDLSVSLTSSVAMPSNTSDFRVWWLHTRNTSLLKGVTILLKQKVGTCNALLLSDDKKSGSLLLSTGDLISDRPVGSNFQDFTDISSITVSSSVTFYWALFPFFTFYYSLNNNLQNKNKGSLISQLTPLDLCSRFYKQLV